MKRLILTLCNTLGHGHYLNHLSPYFGNTRGLRCYRTHRIQCFLQALHNIMTALDWANRMIGPNDFIYVVCHRLLTQFSCLIVGASSWIRETLLKAQIRSTGEVALRWIMSLEPLFLDLMGDWTFDGQLLNIPVLESFP
jgi:hypothetical protein